MRLGEEKTQIRIEIISLIFIVLTTIVGEFANHQISKWETKLLLCENEKSNYLAIKINSNLNQYFSYLISILKVDLKECRPPSEKEFPLKINYIDKEYYELFEKWRNNQITVEEYFKQSSHTAVEKAMEANKLYAQKNEEMLKLLKQEPELSFLKIKIKWNWIERGCNWIRIIAICLALFFYILIYKSIDSRSRKDTTNSVRRD